jgi:hypothetical protein
MGCGASDTGCSGRRLAHPWGILGRSDVDVEPLKDPIEAILDEQEQNESVQVQPVGPEPENAAAVVLRVSGQQGVLSSGTYGIAQGEMLPVEGVLGARTCGVWGRDWWCIRHHQRRIPEDPTRTRDAKGGDTIGR